MPPDKNLRAQGSQLIPVTRVIIARDISFSWRYNGIIIVIIAIYNPSLRYKQQNNKYRIFLWTFRSIKGYLRFIENELKMKIY